MKRILTILSLCAFAACCDITDEVYNPVVGEGMYILTPAEKPEPRINSAEAFGVRPSHPFLYTVASTGVRPITFSAEGLPKGLTLDSKSGIISGVIEDATPKSYQVTLQATNEKGAATQPLEIIVGETICLTPPLGWNSWNCWGSKVTQANVEASAKAMYDKGLVNYGWVYVNIDDAWQDDKRGGKYHAIMPEPEAFPDMQQLCDNVHAMGLKIGIYSTPWVTSYAKRIGGSSHSKDGYWNKKMVEKKGTEAKDRKFNAHAKYKFDENDAKQWAEWGIDYLKYDWYLNDAESTIRMSKALRNSGRDIVFSLSNSCPKELEPICREYAQCWRTTGDLKDRWDAEGNHKNICDVLPLHREWVNGVFEGKPGHFADPDMLVVGYMDRGWNKEMTPSQLSADEQYSHIAYWSLWAAPLLIGCPVERFDDFTHALLTNIEILDIQQDRYAVAGKTVKFTDKSEEVIVKQLYNGDKAVGLFNLSEEKKEISIDWASVGVEGKQLLRDAWRGEDIGKYKDSFTAVVPSHGCVVVVFKSVK